MAKAYGVERDDYETLFLGNSRVDIGLDPRSDAIPPQFRPAYNLGQPGSGSELALRYFEHALSTSSPTTVVLGVDFLNFLRAPGLQSSEDGDGSGDSGTDSSVYNRLSSVDDGSGWDWNRTSQRANDICAAALSLSALQDSLLTVLAQGNSNAADISTQGFNSGAAFRTLIHNEGQAALFRQKNEEYAKKCADRVAPPLEQSDELTAIEDLLSLATSRNIRILVFIHPYHADVLRIFETSGHWGDFEEWKVELSEICDRPGVQLWDFASFNPYSTETPPAAGDKKTVMKWYWESGHYRQALGDQMFVRMLNQDAASQGDRGEWGTAITPTNIQQQLNLQRKARADYQPSKGVGRRSSAKRDMPVEN
ncbi:hypothetical protein [Rubripirellula lacrimiformis]|nr:hypothetical protein [Rubripirellula lacrimiformis]